MGHVQVIPAEVIAQIAAASDGQRQQRQMSVAVVDALKDCGFYKMLLPKQWGGSEHKPQDFFAEQIRIA
jgi:3-hydroxy-9,10-secoandrosta-1,3,5(10)-triene-9,17-dione monooxygenase